MTAAPALRPGVDLIEIERLERALERRPRLAERLFSEGELIYANARGRPARHLAARFAAKEAVFKALGRGRPELGWHDAEVVSDARGRPEVVLSGRALSLAAELGVVHVLVSLSHLRGLAGAQVVASGRSAVREAE